MPFFAVQSTEMRGSLIGVSERYQFVDKSSIWSLSEESFQPIEYDLWEICENLSGNLNFYLRSAFPKNRLAVSKKIKISFIPLFILLESKISMNQNSS